MKRGARGFTLLEVLVALLVFGMLMAGLAQGFRFGAGTMRLGLQASEQSADIDAVERALRRMVRQLDHGSVVLGPPHFIGEPHRVAFTTSLPVAGLDVTPQVDVAIGVERPHQLVLHWQPHFVHPLGPPPPAQSVDMLDGIDHIDLAYWRQAEGWVAREPPSSVPDLIRLRLVFVDSKHRKWPDIVASTAPG